MTLIQKKARKKTRYLVTSYDINFLLIMGGNKNPIGPLVGIFFLITMVWIIRNILDMNVTFLTLGSIIFPSLSSPRFALITNTWDIFQPIEYFDDVSYLDGDFQILVVHVRNEHFYFRDFSVQQ